MAEFNRIFSETEESVTARIFADLDQAWAQVSPRALDKRESSVLQLLTAGVAKELTRFWDELNNVAELAFVQFLEGDFLTDKALEYGLTRLAEETAFGYAAFYGDAGTIIPQDTEVSNLVTFEDDTVYTYSTTVAGAVTTQSAPATPPTVSSGGIGDLDGLYSYLFTYIEVDEDGNPVGETAAGPASADFNASNVKALISNFPPLPADHRLRIYRTPASGTAAGVWSLLVEITDVNATQFLDNFTDDQLGSYYEWDGTPGEEDSPFRTSGPVISSAEPSGFVLVEAEEGGEAFNLPAGDINALRDGISGINSVLNQRDFTTGRDEEPDEAFKPRLIAHIQKPQGAGTQQDYIDWLLEVPGITNVKVTPHFDGVIDRPGYVHCVVSDENVDPVPNEVLVIAREGGILGSTVVDGVDPSPSGSGKGRAPIGAKLVLQTVRKDIMRITAAVRAEEGYALVPATGQINLRVLIDGALAEFIDNLEPGSTIYESDIVRVLRATEGVKDVLLNVGAPDSDLAMEVIDTETSSTSLIATVDGLTGTVSLGKTQVLEYDDSGSNITEAA